MTLLEMIQKENAAAFTHGGKFHADDVFSAALLLHFNPKLTIQRGNRVPEEFAGIVFDIGRGEYDHHQKDSRIRENGAPYAAFVPLWEELGTEILSPKMAECFDEKFVQPLDNNDNTGEKNELASLIGMFNPVWDDNRGSDAAFFEAVTIAGTGFWSINGNVSARMSGWSSSLRNSSAHIGSGSPQRKRRKRWMKRFWFFPSFPMPEAALRDGNRFSGLSVQPRRLLCSAGEKRKLV